MLAWRILAFTLALTLLALALWVGTIDSHKTTCPLESGPFSCQALVRPSLRSLGPLPIAPLLLLGAAVETLATLLLLARGARSPFARDTALLAALGAGFALGLQPLGLLVAGRACFVCLLVLACQLALAFSLGRLAVGAGTRARAIVATFALALLATGTTATLQGTARRKIDEDARTALARTERADARLLLVERPGCPFCEALLLDVLARPEVLARLAKTGLRRRTAERGEPAPLLVALDRDRNEKAREAGFTPDPSAYEEILAAAER